LLGDLARQRDRETEAILEVESLGRSYERFGLESLESQEQPGQGFDEPWVEVIAGKRPEKYLGRIPLRTRPFAIRESGIAEPRESVLDPRLGGSAVGRGPFDRQGGGRESQEPGDRSGEPIGNTTTTALHEADVCLAHAQPGREALLRPTRVSPARAKEFSGHRNVDYNMICYIRKTEPLPGRGRERMRRSVFRHRTEARP
jgi:hypothetical protein